MPWGIKKGVDVDLRADGLVVELRVVVEHGLKLAEVAETVRSRVEYELERMVGLPIASLEVHIDGVRVALMELEVVRHLARSALQNLEAHRRRIDDLNVYPVPDGDTGTNLVLTLRSIVEALDASTAADSEAVAKDVTRAALMGARGNSGVIFSQVVRGFVEVLGRHEGVSSSLLSRAFRGASDTAYRAVKRPVEGTMLTVIREMAEESERKEHREPAPNDLLRVGARARRGRARAHARDARRPAQRRRRRRRRRRARRDRARNGLRRDRARSSPRRRSRRSRSASTRSTRSSPSTATARCSSSRARSSTRTRSRASSSEIGDSLLVVGDSTALKVHVHTDDPGQRARTAARRSAWSRASRSRTCTHQTAQREERLLEGGGAPTALATLETGLVAVCPGRGNRRLFESLGATRVIEGGQSMNPSAADILEAIEAVPTDDVLVLPNNSNVDPDRGAGSGAQREGRCAWSRRGRCRRGSRR